MSKDRVRLQHLLGRLEARYGEHDADVRQLRDAVQRMELEEAARQQAALRYVDAPMFADRATRLSHVPQGGALL